MCSCFRHMSRALKENYFCLSFQMRQHNACDCVMCGPCLERTIEHHQADFDFDDPSTGSLYGHNPFYNVFSLRRFIFLSL